MKKRVEIALFPIAGMGSRLLPLTYGVQKELLPLGRYSLLHRAMREARQAGVEAFVLIGSAESSPKPFSVSDKVSRAGCSPEQERRVREATEEWLSLLEYVVALVPSRADLPSGLAAAVAGAQALVGEQPFAVLLADDVILKEESGLPTLVDAWQRQAGWALSLTEIDGAQFPEFGVIEPRSRSGRLVALEGAAEKPPARPGQTGLGIVGRYLFDSSLFDLIRATQNEVMAEKSQSGFHITGAIDRFARTATATGVLVDGPYYHVGTLDGYFAAWRHLTGADPVPTQP